VRGSRAAGHLVSALLLPALLAPAALSHAQTKPSASSSKAGPVRERHASSARAPVAGRAARALACAHTVRKGDSVSRIAARHRIARAALVAANHLADPAALRIGQRLILPGCEAAAPAASPERTADPPAHGSVVRRVGPRRILTTLVLGEPDFQGEGIPLIWPVEGPVISPFGQRHHGWHAGIDISAERGTQIAAAAPGTVIYSGWARSYGQTIKVQHKNGFITLYAHNLENLVEVGDEVVAGQIIATVGSTGHATGPHVHFEVRRDGRAYDPLHLLEPSDRSPVFEADVAASSTAFEPNE
jgi:murein DD-endopeptidase MepM/ murein hydrolase activator NlpD